MLAAARTSDSARHELLARLVAERLSAPAESEKAVASNRAVEIIPQLAGSHLATLGLLALLYAIRPSYLVIDQAEATGENVIAYRDWLNAMLRAHAPFPEVNTMTLRQIGASGAALFERGALVYLPKILAAGPGGARYPMDPPSCELLLQQVAGLIPLRKLWSHHLEFLRLTPVGLLVGLAYHDVKTGEQRPSEYRWSRTFDLADFGSTPVFVS